MATQSVRIGWRPYVNVVTQVVNATDADAQLFITAAGITDLTQAAAINTLVNDLKTYGLWTKMRALYPFVGGTATSHKFNLKDPRDLDAAFRLVFNGGWVHSSMGALPNGTNGYADSKFIISQLYSSITNIHISYYSRTNTNKYEMIGMQDDNVGQGSQVYVQDNGTNQTYSALNTDPNSISINNNIQSTIGHYLSSRTSLTLLKGYKNGVVQGSNTNTSAGLKSTLPIIIGGSVYKYNSTSYYSGNKEAAFASIGEGLTDTEVNNFYISIQKFQTTLGRHVGTPYVSDTDAVSFLMAAKITDGTQAAAINTLVIRMKADGVWTKMKAIYPFVGGSATSHKWNLKDPRDLDAAYRLVFNGGGTHNSTGYVPNLNSYADTKLNPSTVLNIDSIHFSYYSRTNLMVNNYDMGVTISSVPVLSLTAALRWGDGVTYYSMGFNPTEVNKIQTSTDKNFIFNKITTSASLFENTTKTTTSVTNRSGLPNGNFFIAARNLDGTAQQSSQRNCAFSSIGDGLTDAEVTAFYNAIQAFQTTLGRQVNVPLVSDTNAQAFLNSTGITNYTQANAVNTLVTDLKSAGLWTKIKALYPFVGGSATSHKFNLKDPRDLDAAYRLVFNGGWTHTATGAQPNGTTGYANTFLNPVNFAIASGLGVYSTTNSSISSTDVGALSYYPVRAFQIAHNSTTTFGGVNSDDFVSFADTDTRGFYQAYRTDSNTVKTLKDTTSYSRSLAYYPVNLICLIGGRSENGAVSDLSSRNLSIVYFQENFNDADALTMRTIVQKFQTALGRQIGTPIYNTNELVLNLDAGNANSYPGTGTIWYDLASGKNATLLNGPTYNTNGYLLLDGVNDRIDTSYTPGTFTKQTIVAWINKTNTQYCFILQRNSSPPFGFEIYPTTIYVSYGAFEAYVGYNPTGWNQIVYTYDGTQTGNSNRVKVYVNGVLQTLTFGSNVPSSITINDVMQVGWRPWASLYSGFSISTLQMYNRALSETEVLQNFNSSRGRFGV